MRNPWITGIICLAVVVSSHGLQTSTADEPVSKDLFARKNLVAWCIVPFDSKKRGSEERAAMLEKLGFSQFAYDYRTEHIPTFDAEIEALKRHHIELTAWWFPTSLNDEAKMTLAVFEKHKVTPQLWVTGGGGPTKDEADQRARVIAEAARIRSIAEAAAKVGCKVALYNHGGWFGEPENQIAIIQELKLDNVGIVYNEHHGHEHLGRFPELLQKMKPYLLCFNLNGMVEDGERRGQKILPLSTGDLDLKLLKIVRDSGYTGLIGILGHTQDDAEQRLHDNLDGLDWLLPQLDGNAAGPKPKMRTPVPQPTAEKPKSDQPKSVSSSASVPALTEGKFGKALNGRSGGALVKGRDGFRQFPLTVECWTKLADKTPFNILVAHELKSSGTHWELFSMAGSGQFTVYLPGFAPDHCRSDAMICDDRWHHVAMILEPERVRLFVDGKPVADQKHKRTAQATVPGDVGLATLVDRVIGCTGLVDEVRLSKGVRDITASPDKPFASDETTLALWHLDEIAEQKRLDDASPNKNAALLGDLRSRGVVGSGDPTTTGGGSPPGKPAKIEGHWGEDAVGFRWTEADSRDERFGKMDTGPFFSGSLGPPLAPAVWHDPVYKAIVVRVGSKRQASISYDTELLRATAGWTGFLRFDPARFGIIGAPRPDGPVKFVTPSLPGWSLKDEFTNFRADHRYGPLPKDISHYEGLYRHGQRVVLRSRVSSDESRVPVQKAQGKGLRGKGQNVESSPSLGPQPSALVDILETPWLEETPYASAFTRTLLIGPTKTALRMIVADPKARVRLHPRSQNASVAPGHGGCAVLTVAPHDEPVTVKLFIASPDTNEAALDKLVAASPAPEDVLALTKPGPAIWGGPLVTKGEVGGRKAEEGKNRDNTTPATTALPVPPSAFPYLVDTITLPFDNPFNALFFCGGHDFLPDGRAFVCTLHGDVWLVDGIDEKLERITWRRFATGLFQPLGVKSRVLRVESRELDKGKTSSSSLALDTRHSTLDSLFVVGRDQITRLHDLNGDGEADYYENFNNDAHVTMNGHEYVACLEADRAGNLYYVKGNNNSQTPHDGSVLRVSADGSKLDVFATGFRNSNGMGMGPHDELTVAPQEGEWTPASGVFDVREGGFYGMMLSHHQATPPTDFIRPICWFSRRDDNSSGGQVWTTSDHWGPLANQLLHMSYGQCRLRLVLREEVQQQTGEPGAVRPRVTPPEEPGALRHPARQDSLQPFNGGSIELPLRFNSGIHRGRMNPRDGQLYVTGLRGWTTSAVHDGCFQRVRYVGAPSQPQAGVIPSPPFSGERASSLLKIVRREGEAPAEPRETRDFPPASGSAGASPSLFQQAARVRGPDGEQTHPRQQASSSTDSPNPTAKSPSKAPLSLTLSPEDGGEGTRVAATNASEPFPIAMKTYRNGIALTFTSELDREVAEDPSSYDIEAWNYKWSAAYGSPEFKPSAPGQEGRDDVEPKSVTLLEDSRTIFIELPGLKSVDQLAVSYTLLTPDNRPVEQKFTLTLNSIPETLMPEKLLHRPTVDPANVALHERLKPGVVVRFPNSATAVTRRLMAWTCVIVPWMTQDIRATAYLKVPATGLYRFNADVDRAGILEIDGKTYPLGDDDVTIRLSRGFTRIKVGHWATREFSRFRLMWESDRFPREAVPPTVLFYDPQESGEAIAQNQTIAQGRALFAEHNCSRCHIRWPEGARGDISHTIAESLRGAPRLDGIGSRLRSDWLAAWLRDPAHLRSDATMPKLRETANDAELNDLLAHLASLRHVDTSTDEGPDADKPDGATIADGAATFERLGCIACHTLSANAATDEWNRVSLHFVKSKFQPGRLVRFLLTPQRLHAGSRMPDFHLSEAEARQLASYIEDRSTGVVPPLAENRSGNAERGRALFAKWRCGHCHMASPTDRLAEPDVRPAFRILATSGCLASPSNRDQAAPEFSWTDSERDVILKYVTAITRGVPSQDEKAEEMIPRLMTSLRCNACHARDERRALWPEIVAEEGSGRAMEVVPQLTWVGEKLQGPWIEKLLKGELDRRMGTLPVRGSTQVESSTGKPDGQGAHPTSLVGKPRPWLTARMPSFPAYASILAHGLAAEHGLRFEEPLPEKLDPDQVEIGRQLTLQNGGLDCRQCHGVGKEQPRGDTSTQIALGINFALTRDRLRPEFALRQMLDPPRYDIGSRMPRFAPDLRTTAAKHFFGGDARKQFEALKQFILSVKMDE